MKEQTRNTEVQINEEEIGKLPEKEFRIMIVKMIKNLKNKMKKIQDQLTDTQKKSRTFVLEKTLESPLDFEEIKPVYPEGNQS